jgi:flagellar motility protein MotE (MotC chaperone)
MYSNMKPQQAAKVFETMDEELAVEIIGRMKKKNAAEIMNLIKAEKAQIFSEKFAGYRRSVAQTQPTKEGGKGIDNR